MRKTMLHKMGSVLLCTVLLLALMPALPARADTPQKHLLVSGCNFEYDSATTGRWTDTPPSSIHYDPATATLRLTNYTGGTIDSYGVDLTLELVGQNTIRADASYGLRTTGFDSGRYGLLIRAAAPGASLRVVDVTGGKSIAAYAILAPKSLTLESGAIYADSAPYYNVCLETYGALTIGKAASFSGGTAPVPHLNGGAPLPATALSASGGLYAPGARKFREGNAAGALAEVAQLTLASTTKPTIGGDPTTLCSAAFVQVDAVVSAPPKGPADTPDTTGDPTDDASPEEPAVAGLSLNMGAKLLKTGQKVALKAAVTPADAADKAVEWTTSNKAVATVSPVGIVQAVKPGKATITARAGGQTARCTITVRAKTAGKAVQAVKLEKRIVTLKTGKTSALNATLKPVKPLNKKLIWASSDTSVATVSAKGVVKAKAKGRAKITATSVEGGKTATCTIIVK